MDVVHGHTHLTDGSVVRLRHLHRVLHGARQRPGVDDATSGQQPLVLVVEEHAVDALLAGSLLVVGEHL